MQAERSIASAGWLAEYNLKYLSPEEMETCLFQYRFLDGRVVEEVVPNIAVKGTLSRIHLFRGGSFRLLGNPEDQVYTEEGYRKHTYVEETR